MNHRVQMPFDSTDSRSCLAFIAALPINSPLAAQQALPDFLSALYKAPPPAVEYLEVLEMLRAPLAGVQGEVSRQFASKPLPPGEAEQAAFTSVVALWQAMARAYAQIARLGGREEAILDKLATICQRCIHYSGQVIFEHYRGRRAFSSGLWLDLHGYFATAEEWGLATEHVVDSLGVASRSTTCAHTYASVLLADLANPYGRIPDEFSTIRLWSQRFASHTTVRPPPEDEGCRGFGVDLMLDRGLQPVENLAGTDTARVFDTAALTGELMPLLARLKDGALPGNLGLGAEIQSKAAQRLLLQLYRPWCLAAVPRRFQRFRASGTLSVCHGVDTIHYFVGGREFVQPEHVRTFSRAEVDQLWTFRSQLDPTQPLHQRAAQLGFAFENWEILDSSLNGYRLRRGAVGTRVSHGQLMCFKPPGSEHFVVARMCWLMLETDGSLQAGLQLLPGRPQAISVRAAGPGVSPSEHYVRAFLLPGVPEIKEPPTLITPPEWFYADRVVEIYTERQVQLRLTQVLEQGSDFERIAYAAA